MPSDTRFNFFKKSVEKLDCGTIGGVFGVATQLFLRSTLQLDRKDAALISTKVRKSTKAACEDFKKSF